MLVVARRYSDSVNISELERKRVCSLTFCPRITFLCESNLETQAIIIYSTRNHRNNAGRRARKTEKSRTLERSPGYAWGQAWRCRGGGESDRGSHGTPSGNALRGTCPACSWTGSPCSGRTSHAEVLADAPARSTAHSPCSHSNSNNTNEIIEESKQHPMAHMLETMRKTMRAVNRHCDLE